MNIKTAVVAGFILNAGLGGAVFAQGTYSPRTIGKVRHLEPEAGGAHRPPGVSGHPPPRAGRAPGLRSTPEHAVRQVDGGRRPAIAPEQPGIRAARRSALAQRLIRVVRTAGMTIRDLRRSSSQLRRGLYNGQAAAMVGRHTSAPWAASRDAVGLREYTARVVRDGWTQRDICARPRPATSTATACGSRLRLAGGISLPPARSVREFARRSRYKLSQWRTAGPRIPSSTRDQHAVWVRELSARAGKRLTLDNHTPESRADRRPRVRRGLADGCVDDGPRGYPSRGWTRGCAWTYRRALPT